MPEPPTQTDPYAALPDPVLARLSQTLGVRLGARLVLLVVLCIGAVAVPAIVITALIYLGLWFR